MSDANEREVGASGADDIEVEPYLVVPARKRGFLGSLFGAIGKYVVGPFLLGSSVTIGAVSGSCSSSFCPSVPRSAAPRPLTPSPPAQALRSRRSSAKSTTCPSSSSDGLLFPSLLSSLFVCVDDNKTATRRRDHHGGRGREKGRDVRGSVLFMARNDDVGVCGRKTEALCTTCCAAWERKELGGNWEEGCRKGDERGMGRCC